MRPEKAYILRITSPLSREYADTCARSCESVGIQYEFFDGVENMTSYNAWTSTGLEILQGSMDHRINDDKIDKAACCSVSHALIWKRIAETQQCAIVLEHDALMLHPINMNIPDGKIVVLGYKLNDPSKYDHIAAGPPRKIIDIDHHNGAHAYALTPKTAQSLLDELRTGGGGGPIDNRFFMKKRRSRVPLAVVDPTPAIGWIRQSTIWNKADTFYGSTISSFHKHLKS